MLDPNENIWMIQAMAMAWMGFQEYGRGFVIVDTDSNELLYSTAAHVNTVEDGDKLIASIADYLESYDPHYEYVEVRQQGGQLYGRCVHHPFLTPSECAYFVNSQAELTPNELHSYYNDMRRLFLMTQVPKGRLQ